MNLSNQLFGASQALVMVPTVALGLLVGTFAARYLYLNAAPTKDTYDVETAVKPLLIM